MARDFMLALMFGMVLYIAGEFFFYVHFKMISIMLGMTFVFGLLSSEVDEAAGNLMGLIAGQAVGLALCIVSARPDFPLTLPDEVLRGLVDQCDFLLWAVGFPSGFMLRRFMPHSFSKTSEAVAAQTEFEAQAARARFINNELGANTRPLHLSLREQTPADLETSPSIHLIS